MDYRDRSPMNGGGHNSYSENSRDYGSNLDSGRYMSHRDAHRMPSSGGGGGGGGPGSSDQARRVYVGNLSYDVKWHHLKDFMRQGELVLSVFIDIKNALTD